MAVIAAEARASPHRTHIAEPLPDRWAWTGEPLARPLNAPLLAGLSGHDRESGHAFATLAQAAAAVAEECRDLSIAQTRGELLSYRSYYLTGVLNEKPRASFPKWGPSCVSGAAY